MMGVDRTPILREHERPDPPMEADEVTMLRAFLDYQRSTLAWKAGGLDSDELATQVAASSITLGGLLKHMAWVENYWFSWRLHGHEPQAPWNTVDWQADPKWDWNIAGQDTPRGLFNMWWNAAQQSEAAIEEALADGGLDRAAATAWPDGSSPTLRWIMVHMIEEYARHNGHADLIRESIDGLVGE